MRVNLIIPTPKGDGAFEAFCIGQSKMKLSEFAALDLKAIPSDALKIIYHSIRRELEKRGASDGLSRKAYLANASVIIKKHPREKEIFSKKHLSYLDDLLSQDWSNIFQDGDSEKKYYVYLHIQPIKNISRLVSYESNLLKMDFSGMPFYVGKGCGDRAYDMKRNQGHGIELKQLLTSGVSEKEIVHIIKDGMTEKEAFILESKLIYFFGTKFEKNRRGILVNLDIPRRPEFTY